MLILIRQVTMILIRNVPCEMMTYASSVDISTWSLVNVGLMMMITEPGN